MKCPNCKANQLVKKEIEGGPQVLECPSCGGFWVKSFEYWKWKCEHREEETSKENGEELKSVERNEAKLCPECSKILRRYEVGKGMDFSLDRCNSCGGIWFDKNEWAIIKGHGLDSDINKIFGLHWQNEILKQKLTLGKEKILENIFGKEELEELKRVKKWIYEHKNSAEIMAFLTNKLEL